MTMIAWALLGFCLAALLLHAASIALVWARLGSVRADTPLPSAGESVTIMRPVCGLEAVERVTLASSFDLSWPNTELLFCVASAADPALPFLRGLLARHQGCSARILLGDDRQTANPKLNNLEKGWRAASCDWIIMADSNLLLPQNYVELLLARVSTEVGLICAPPIAANPSGFWAEVECGFLNTYQARWQYAADAVGFGFAQGKTMLWRRADLERLGGITALASELAEDAAATKLVRASGRKVRLAGPAFEQPIGERSFSQVISRQTRWAQLRRHTFPGYFLPEILTGSLPPALAGALASALLHGPAMPVAMVVIGFCLALEALLARAAGWPLTWRSPFAWLVRDLLIPLVWLRALTANGYEWRGNKISFDSAGSGARVAAMSAGTA